MRNEVIYDKNGRPDIMVVFTRPSWDSLTP